MVASMIVGTIVVIFFLIYLLYRLMKKAVISGTMEALETYDKMHDTSREKTMIEIGAEIQDMRKKQMQIDKQKAQQAKKEAQKEARKNKR